MLITTDSYFQTLNATKHGITYLLNNLGKPIHDDSLRHQCFIILLQNFDKIRKQQQRNFPSVLDEMLGVN